jgi:hypothetical protein
MMSMFNNTSEITRATTNKYTSMPGLKKPYLFMAVRDEVVLQRDFACWCPSCLQASAPGEGTTVVSSSSMHCLIRQLDLS